MMFSCDDAAHLALTELEGDIACNLKTEEKTKMPNLRLIQSQTEITDDMRHQLVEFLTQSKVSLSLCDETLSLAINLLDRYMSKRFVYAKVYQLLGTVCLWLASKVCDDKRKILTTKALSYICAHTYPESMFTEMEFHVLSTLNWHLISPIPLDFIDMEVADATRILCSSGIECSPDAYAAVRDMAKYLSECSLYYKEFVNFTPSAIASSAVVLSGIVLDSNNHYGWPMLNTSNCLQECFDSLVAIISNPPPEAYSRFSGSEVSYASIRFQQYLTRSTEYSSDYPASPISEHYLYDEESLYSPTSEADSFMLPLSPQSINSDTGYTSHRKSTPNISPGSRLFHDTMSEYYY